jgi:dTDP-4-dehydrorhamnose reductase
MKPKILLVGKNGQVGSALVGSLPQLGEVIALDRHQLNLMNPGDIRDVIREVHPALIINAAAFTAVDLAETEIAAAEAINATAPGIMAEEANAIGAGIIHYSTDYVFDGRKTSPYEEDDPANPLNVYGKTKLAGENAIRNSGVSHLIFRTAWVYSTHGRNFLLTILRLATQREELRIVRDQVGAPTWSVAIAEVTKDVLTRTAERQEGNFDLSAFGGTYHMTAAGTTTWYDFAKAIFEEASQISDIPGWLDAATDGAPIRTNRIIPITAEQYPTPARRPAYSVLSNSALKNRFAVEMSDWRVQLHKIFRQVPSS